MSKILDSIKLPKKATKLKEPEVVVKQPEVVEEPQIAAPEPTPEPTELVLPEENPIIKMAIEQAEARRIKDQYHGFK